MREQSSSNITHTHKVFRGGETKVMKKSLLSLLIFALVFTMAAPAFAATGAAVNLSDIGNSYAKEEIEALVEAGVIGGYADGTFKPANSITRAEFAKILALVLDLEEDAAAASVFTDVPAWAKGYVGALVNAELTQGVNATTYGSNQNISREQLATFFVRAWGLEEAAEEVDLTPKFNDADKIAPYAKANVALAGEIEFIKGLPNGNFDPKGNAQRQAVARLAYEFYANSEEYLAAAEDVINAAKPTLEVTDVKATNLKEVYVDFNQAVAEGTVVDANFTVKDKDDKTVGTVATLNEDGTSVTLTVYGDGLANQGKYKLTVDKVKSTSDIAIEKVEKEFTAFDATLPEVKDVVVTGPRSFDIVFSEPIKDPSKEATQPKVEVKNENVTIGVNQSFNGYGSATISVDLFSDMVDGKSYDVTISNFVDYAGYKNVINTTELAYAKDETAPEATVVKAEQEYVVVKFNKPVSGLSAEHFYHSFSAWKAVGIYKDANMKDEDAITVSDKVSTVYVSFHKADNKDSRPLPEGKVTFVVADKVGSNEIKDNWGNKFVAANYELNIVADKVTPEVTELKVQSEESLRVTFNKNVKFENGNVEVLNTDGSKIDGVYVTVSKVSNSSKQYDINFGKNLSGKTVLVKITNVEDLTLAGNKLSSYTETITVTDKTAPEVSEIRVGDASDKAIYVFFTESVNSTGIDKGNYRFVEETDTGSKLVAFTGTPSFYTDNKIVKLALTDAQWNDFAAQKFTGLQVVNVEDLAGNKLVGQTTIKFGNIGDYAPTVKSVYATAKDKLEITFDQFMPVVHINAFTVKGESPAAIHTTTNSKGHTVVTLTVRSKFATDLSGTNDKVYTVADDSKLLANAFNKAVTNSASLPVVEDGIAPELAKIGTTNVDDVKAVDNTVVLTFTEAIAANSVSVSTFSVSGRTVESVSVSGETVTLTLNAAAPVGASVTQNSAVRDLHGNSKSGINTRVAE